VKVGEVRKAAKLRPYRTPGCVRTNRAVGWLPTGSEPIPEPLWVPEDYAEFEANGAKSVPSGFLLP